MKQNPIVIKTNNLTKKYGNFKAVDNLSLEIKTNCIFGFLGPNGAGKSTFMKMLIGLVSPTEGEVEVFGLPLKRNALDIKSRIGYLPQDPKFLPYLTVYEILQYVSLINNKDNNQDEINYLIKLLDLIELKNQQSSKLSGGERQRLGIAQAMINSPDLLILDEPASALDPQGRKKVLDIIEELGKKSTVFYSTHILDDVQRVSDEVAIINKGKLVIQGDIKTLLNLKNDATNYAVKGKGKVKLLIEKLSKLNYVSSVKNESQTEKELFEIYISVSDSSVAEERLLFDIAQISKEAKATVFGFNIIQDNLESVFLRLTNLDEK